MCTWFTRGSMTSILNQPIYLRPLYTSTQISTTRPLALQADEDCAVHRFDSEPSHQIRQTKARIIKYGPGLNFLLVSRNLGPGPSAQIRPTSSQIPAKPIYFSCYWPKLSSGTIAIYKYGDVSSTSTITRRRTWTVKVFTASSCSSFACSV
jgi:hypothetical protein